eukprot:COSAG01_NODE_4858_length_4678_cov_12.236078_3_plen_185_part_00
MWFVAAVLTEIYLWHACSSQQIRGPHPPASFSRLLCALPAQWLISWVLPPLPPPPPPCPLLAPQNFQGLSLGLIRRFAIQILVRPSFRLYDFLPAVWGARCQLGPRRAIRNGGVMSGAGVAALPEEAPHHPLRPQTREHPAQGVEQVRWGLPFHFPSFLAWRCLLCSAATRASATRAAFASRFD